MTLTTAQHQGTCRRCGVELTWDDESDIPTDGAGLLTCDDCYDDTTGYAREEES